MSSFVPGPWVCSYTSYHAHDYRIGKPDGSLLPVHAPYNDRSQQRATARLISAAPDLLDALERFLVCLDEKYGADVLPYNLSDENNEVVNSVVLAARAAVSKARGS